MRNFLCIFLACFLFSCGKKGGDGITYLIKNSMNSTVTAVKLVAQNGGKTTELFDVSSIAPQMIERVSINQSKLPDSDGGYQLKFTVSSTPRIIDFGYFTNGIELNQSYSIEIESDTVKITPQLRD